MGNEDYQFCTEITPQCPLSATVYGYYPNLTANSIFLTIFAICTIAQLTLGIWYKLRAFTFAVTLGCLGECLGYGGRIIMHSNPWSSAGFKIQIVCIILSPSLLAAGIYLALKHLVLVMGREKSRLRPNLYTWIFILCDVFSIILQAGGGGVSASNSPNLIAIGDHVMTAGVAFQVVTMFVCIALALDFGWTVLKSRRAQADRNSEKALHNLESRRFRYYLACTSVAFLAIFIRCIYRYVPLNFSANSGNLLTTI